MTVQPQWPVDVEKLCGVMARSDIAGYAFFIELDNGEMLYMTEKISISGLISITEHINGMVEGVGGI